MAIKVVEHSPGVRESLSLAEQKIEREALLATSLSHPNIIATFKICTMTAGALPVLTCSPHHLTADIAAFNPAPCLRVRCQCLHARFPT